MCRYVESLDVFTPNLLTRLWHPFEIPANFPHSANKTRKPDFNPEAAEMHIAAHRLGKVQAQHRKIACAATRPNRIRDENGPLSRSKFPQIQQPVVPARDPPPLTWHISNTSSGAVLCFCCVCSSVSEKHAFHLDGGFWLPERSSLRGCRFGWLTQRGKGAVSLGVSGLVFVFVIFVL